MCACAFNLFMPVTGLLCVLVCVCVCVCARARVPACNVFMHHIGLSWIIPASTIFVLMGLALDYGMDGASGSLHG